MSEVAATPRRFVDPKRFVLGIGVPLTKEEWDRPLAGSKQRSLHGNSWDNWKSLLVHWYPVLDFARRLGVRIVTVGDLDALRRIFVDRPEVVTLFAHTYVPKDRLGCTGQADSAGCVLCTLELLTERLSWEQLQDAVPDDFDGMLDLRFCCAEDAVAESFRGRDIIVHAVGSTGDRLGLAHFPPALAEYRRALEHVASGSGFHVAVSPAEVELRESLREPRWWQFWK